MSNVFFCTNHFENTQAPAKTDNGFQQGLCYCSICEDKNREILSPQNHNSSELAPQMSVEAVRWVLESSKSSDTARLVLLVLAEHADRHTCDCFPSIALIAREAKKSVRTVQRAIQDLIELGELEIFDSKDDNRIRVQSNHRPNLYRLPGVTPVTPPKKSGVSSVTARGDKQRGKSQSSPYIDKEPSGNRAQEGKKSQGLDSLVWLEQMKNKNKMKQSDDSASP